MDRTTVYPDDIEAGNAWELAPEEGVAITAGEYTIVLSHDQAEALADDLQDAVDENHELTMSFAAFCVLEDEEVSNYEGLMNKIPVTSDGPLVESVKRATSAVEEAEGFGAKAVLEAIRDREDPVYAFYAHAEETGASREPWLEGI
jgi:hypothetical protein